MDKQALLQLRESEKLSALQRNLTKPNLFQLIGLHEQEIKHSYFLGQLLDPKSALGTHKLFSRGLIALCLNNLKFELQEHNNLGPNDFENGSGPPFELFREKFGVDLLVVDDYRQCFFAIENKIRANESAGQLRRYRLELEAAFPSYTKLFIFLTPDGRDPKTDFSWVPLSYGDISRLLKSLIGRAQISDLTELLLQHYADLLERYILGDSKLSDLANEIYQEHKAAIDFIIEKRSDPLRLVSTYIDREFYAPSSGLASIKSNKSNLRYVSENMSRLSSVLPGDGWGDGNVLCWEIAIRRNVVSISVILGPLQDKSLRSNVRDHLNKLLGGKAKTQQWSRLKTWKALTLGDSFDPQEIGFAVAKEFKRILARDGEFVDEAIDSVFKRVQLG